MTYDQVKEFDKLVNDKYNQMKKIDIEIAKNRLIRAEIAQEYHKMRSEAAENWKKLGNK